jgi:hypothetical protein
MDIGELALDEVKSHMSRLFPELADPKIETLTDKKTDTVTYVFSKKAGIKGATNANPLRSVVRRMVDSIETDELIAEAADTIDAVARDGAVEMETRIDFDEVNSLMNQEAQNVIEIRKRLSQLTPLVVCSGSVL